MPIAWSKIRQKQFYWTLVTEPAVQKLVCSCFGEAFFHILGAKESTVSVIVVHFLLSELCNYTMADHKTLPPHPDPNGLYVHFEVSIFCVYLHGVSHCVFSHKPRNVQQNKSIIARQGLNLQEEIEEKKQKLAVIFTTSTGFKNKAIDKFWGLQPFYLFVCPYICFIWKKWL